MVLLKQLDEALDYIENNLDGDISFDELARIACCSTYYFQRMFSYLAGIPVSEYIRRRKMTAAAFDLKEDNAKISEIGAKYGYKSPTAFNRAFQSVHGVAPSAVWKNEVFLSTYPRLHLNISVTGNKQMKYRIEAKEAIRIVGVNISLTTDIKYNFAKVPKFWKKVISDGTSKQLKKLMNQNPRGMLGVTVYNKDNDISYTIGVASDNKIQKGMAEVQLQAQTWVIFECIGVMPEAFQELYRRFFTEWLPVSDYEYVNGPDLEVYCNSDILSQEYKCELWMAVTNKKK